MVELLTIFLFAILIILFLVAVWGIFNILAKKHPTLYILLNALQPHVMTGIWAAERIAYESLSELGNQLSGVDRKAIADSLYGTIPDVIMIENTPIPVGLAKSIVTKEQFEQYVQDNYDRMLALLAKNREYLESQVEDWQKTTTSTQGGGTTP